MKSAHHIDVIELEGIKYGPWACEYMGSVYGSTSLYTALLVVRNTPEKSMKPSQPKSRFDLEKLWCAVQATIVGKFTSVAKLVDEDFELDS